MKKKAPTARKVRVSFGTPKNMQDRLRAVAKRERMTVACLIEEALCIHLHRLETNGDPRLRRKSVCWRCGDILDAATGGMARAGVESRRTTKS